MGPGEYRTTATGPEGPSFTIPHSGIGAADLPVSHTPAPGAIVSVTIRDMACALRAFRFCGQASETAPSSLGHQLSQSSATVCPSAACIS